MKHRNRQLQLSFLLIRTPWGRGRGVNGGNAVLVIANDLPRKGIVATISHFKTIAVTVTR